MVLGVSQKTSLDKTTAEKVLLRNIAALESGIREETDPEKKLDLESQLSSIKSHLSRLSGKTYVDLRLENLELKKQVSEIREKRERAVPLKDDSSMNLVKLYSLILERYSDVINEHESKTVGEIKALVNKDDLTIQSLSNEFKIEDYDFENHYFQAAEKAFDYVRGEIIFVKPDANVAFWLTPKEIASEKIGDDEDQAVFLCSLLYSLGDEKAEVVIAELENSGTHAFVITEWNKKFMILDPCQEHSFRDFYGEKREVLEKYSFQGSHIKKFLYKFNNSNYEQFSEQ